MSAEFLKSAGVFHIPAGQDFARALAQGILDRAEDVQQLTKWRIYLPSQRTCQSVQTAFLDIVDGKPLLLPQLFALGESDEWSNELFDGLLSGYFDSLPDAIDIKHRQFLLAQLIGRMKIGGYRVSEPQSLGLAEELGNLLDQIRQAGSDPAELPGLIPDEFSSHWKDIAQFLDILFTHWPAILGEKSLLDPIDRKVKLQERLCQIWQQNPPQTPVVIAGSTGSLPSTAKMMQAVLSLSKGMVVLPGLAVGTTDNADQDAIHEDICHPQHQLFSLCQQLKWPIKTVQPWREIIHSDAEIQRQKLWAEVFRPYQQTHFWRRMDKTEKMLTAQAVEGISMISARSLHHEADVIASLFRKTLNAPGKTALLVTPDRKLARTVQAALLRWGLEVEDSAGQPLPQTVKGNFLDLVARWVCNKGNADSLLALAKHRLSCGGLAKAEFNTAVRQIEMAVLRDILPADHAEGIAHKLAVRKELSGLSSFYIQHLLSPLEPLSALLARPSVSLSEMAQAHGLAAEKLAQTDIENAAMFDLWGGADGKIAAQLLSDIAKFGQNISISPLDYADCFYQLAHQKTVRTAWRTHPRLAILGTVEARMQSADLVILGGLNEGVWPPVPDHSPWVNQQMREQLGLPHKRWRTGLSAHDFYMLAHHKELVITRSETTDETSNVASRWWQRLEAVLAATGLNDALKSEVPKDIQAGLAHGRLAEPMPVQPPRPCPDIAVRPRKFWATDMDVLIRDPYAIYAKYILKLRPLDEIARPADAALRGSLYHECLAQYVEKFPSGKLPENALEELEKIADDIFSAFQNNLTVKRFWRQRFTHIASWFITHEKACREHNSYSLSEKSGRILLQAPNGPITLGAKADRLDRSAAGKWSIIDYKTGLPPSSQQVQKGRATQLLIEAFIAAQGGFEGQKKEADFPIESLEYWHLTGKAAKPAEIKNVTPEDFDLEYYFERLKALLLFFEEPESCYPSEPDSTQRPRFSSYRHLARVREWRKHDVDDDD